ncbi:hydrogenase maturation nickel metallochaperone HypA [Rhodovulum sulfidophilum]|uniref:Hydrogenase maturation factor HypA n=1 Tax=Rhodovulum sulfidophilum TaxID=35806 RepID=A0A0D6B5F3_RHOSU|nr:hydrogenase maturation nickel metallochaperone HypA [Rhodovulum sulfidophilum]ANB35741.1 hydrogenase nickel incorporation protein HypA [Rhodovulum sulfidophilum DSM 1374]ANB39563.1 hydrogenase nickel incorporation protein HypA [Rhodovulum sulfidophilum]MBK5924662.1 hydrogenase maturation nickel metallochaperone HypA [Rhodovulum sulfidophilum]MBL3551370.1 hydrogenase maturation nickel metallochaperone HypA [Rhodovulum sulfidophilum]MBL3560440.1 hydrogenase maturation nickel metallochaperone 
MHEMSLCEGIRGIVEDQARAHGFATVRVLRLEIGRFAGVEKPALEFAFDVVMRGSPAEGARLEMIDLPGRAMCYDCAEEVEIENRLDPCPRCGGGKLMPVAGDEMRIKDMEVV